MLIYDARFKNLEELSCLRYRYQGGAEDSPGPVAELQRGTEENFIKLHNGTALVNDNTPLMQALVVIFCGLCFETRSSMLPMLVLNLESSCLNFLSC